MNKLTTLGFALAVGLLVSAAPAKAESFTFDALGKNPPAPSNKFHISISRVGVTNTFNVTIKRDGFNAVTGLNPIHAITIGFYCCQDHGSLPFDDSNLATVSSLSGGTNTNTAETTFNTWETAFGGSSAHFVTGLNSRVLKPNGNGGAGNQVQDLFKGTVTLATSKRVAGVSVVLQDTNQQYQGTAVDPTAPDCVPEPNTLALALPGLLPLTALLRGRFSKKNEDEKNEA